MLYYAAYCFDIFFVVLEIFVLLYLIRKIIPIGVIGRGAIEFLVYPILPSMQKLVRRSALNCFNVDVSPYILIIILTYLNDLCSYIMDNLC